MRGVRVSYETVREWCLKFGQPYPMAYIRNFEPNLLDHHYWRVRILESQDTVS